MRAELTATPSLKAKANAAMPKLATISGARIWCADKPAAFIAMTSLCWLRAVKVISAPSSAEKGRKRWMSKGTRRVT